MDKRNDRVGLIIAGLTAISICAFTPLPTVAEEDPKFCARLQDAALRLACYDGVFRTQIITDASPGKWRTATEKSKVDDKEMFFAHLEANAPYQDKFGRAHSGNLHVRCMDGKTSMFVAVKGAFFSDIQGYGRLTIRIDRKPAVQKSANVSTDSEAIGLWSGSEAIPILKQMQGAKYLYMGFTPYNESPASLEFDITGVDDALLPIRKACKW